MSYYIRYMREENVSQASEIDREAFLTMLPPTDFKHELNNLLAHYIVACYVDDVNAAYEVQPEKNEGNTVIGFAGFWIMADEAHIVNLAVRQSHQRRGVGELLLINMIEMAIGLEAPLITLEVRASNTIAQHLYHKYGFTDRGFRRKYYTDNKEDAVIMTADDIKSPAYRLKLNKLRKAYLEKWGTSLDNIKR